MALIDFDAARAERTKEPLLLRAYGETFELPGSMPASLFLDILRIEQERDSKSKVTVKEAVGLLRRVLPQEILDGLVARSDFEMDDLIELSGMVMRAYMGASSRDDSGEAPAPNRAARRHPPTKSAQSRGSRAGLTSPSQKPPTAPAGQTS